MKTETQIAEENMNKITELKFNLRMKRVTTTPTAQFDYHIQVVEEKAKEHKATCQRFLEFLEGIHITIGKSDKEEKITDLKQAIKLYEDAGI